MRPIKNPTKRSFDKIQKFRPTHKIGQVQTNIQTKSEKSDKFRPTPTFRQIQKMSNSDKNRPTIRQFKNQKKETNSEKSDNFRQTFRDIWDNRTTDKISSLNLSVLYILHYWFEIV